MITQNLGFTLRRMVRLTSAFVSAKPRRAIQASHAARSRQDFTQS
jgi:hypothetical protein